MWYSAEDLNTQGRHKHTLCQAGTLHWPYYYSSVKIIIELELYVPQNIAMLEYLMHNVM